MKRTDEAWLLAQTPVIEGWKAEDAAFASYCARRDEGHSAQALARFFAPYWAGDFEKRYLDEKHLQAVERDPLKGFSYSPPLETTCDHGKQFGPCALCRQDEQREEQLRRIGP